MIGRICAIAIITIVNLGICADGRAEQDPPAAVDGAGIDKPLAGRIAALKREFEARDKALFREVAALRKAGAKGSTKEIKEAIGNHSRDWQAIADEVVALVRAHPADPSALEGILLLGVFIEDDLVKIVRTHFLSDPRMGRLCASLADRTMDSSEGLLRDIAAGGADRQIRGQATYALGLYSRNLCRRMITGNALLDPEQEPLYSRAQWELLRRMNPDRTLTDPEQERLLAETRGYFDRVVKDYPDVTSADGTSRLADRARADLAWIANLSGLRIGKVAPDVLGEDLGGNPLDLNDYRGKVVVLCFWATWCGPCMAMVPHERELVKRMGGKPFALLGINADEADKREEARKAARDEQMNWPSFWDGGLNGPIQTRYNVEHFPTLYVLDPRGVIRYIDVRGKDLDRAVDALLSESETGSRRDADRQPGS